MPLRGRVQPCVRPVDAAPMAAGPDEVRGGSDPKSRRQAPRAAMMPNSSDRWNAEISRSTPELRYRHPFHR
jgi:hypothetical protein